MARNLFGGTASDVAEDIDGRRIGGAVGTVWDGPSDQATRITDLMDADGAPIIQLVSDVRGFVPPFYGPDNAAERVWVDFGVGKVALVSVTVGERLQAHAAATDPHQDRAYTDERLTSYLPLSGGEINIPVDGHWLTASVPDEADPLGDVWRVWKATESKAYTRLKSTGALHLQCLNTDVPLAIGAPGYAAGAQVIRVSNGDAGVNTPVFEVRGDGSVVSASTVTASNVGSARVYSGPNAPAAPKAGDVWVQYA